MRKTIILILLVASIAAHAAQVDPWEGWVFVCTAQACPIDTPKYWSIEIDTSRENFGLFEECYYPGDPKWPSNCRIIPGQSRRYVRRNWKIFVKAIRESHRDPKVK